MKRTRMLSLLVLAVVLPLVSGCFTILSIDQVTTATTGSKIVVTIEVRTEGTDANPHHGIFAVLVPNDWKVDSVYYSGDFGPDYATYLPAEMADGDPGGQVDYWEPALETNYPSGPDMKWVVYQGKNAYASNLDTGYVDVTVEMTVGNRSGNFNIGYFVTNAALDFTDRSYYDIKLDNPIRVTSSGPVRVTFVANTATVPDTLGATSTVQVRGSGGPLTWNGASPVFLQNVGGDYWRGSAEFTPGERVEFKFYTNVHDTVYAGAEWEHQGWEGDVATGNRVLVVGDADTTLPLQFVNGWLWGVEQYARPWVSEPNSFVVWVRVNVQGWEDFNPGAQVIGLRGSNNVDWGQTGEISWGRTYPLVREGDHVNMGSRQYSGGYFYSGAVHVPVQYAGKGLEFKVVVHRAGAPLDEGWGDLVYNPSLQNHVEVSGVDTTVHWFWFDNKRPRAVEHRDQVVVTWVADLGQAIANFGFAHGDTLLVRSGYFGTAAGVRTVQMRRIGFTSRYTATDTVVTTIGGKLDYQYYKVKHGVEYREIYYNFYYGGETVGEAERRVQDPVGGAVITIEDVVASKSDIHRMPLFRNTAVVARPVTVTFTCDARPAVYQVLAGSTLRDIQGTLHVTSADQVIAWGMAMNGPATGGWGTWGAGLMVDPAHRMYDDGTHGDVVAGDSVYTLVCFYSPDSNDVVGQEFKFGIGGGDNEGGYGNNHIENIDDSVPVSVIHSQFGSIDPVFYSAWDYDNQRPRTGVEVVRGEVPREYGVGNYPNPFNPGTEVRYQVVRGGRVRVEVYNVMGVKVATLVDEEQPAGSYRVRWEGSDERGQQVSAGVYVCRLVAGEVVKTAKMVLVR